MEKYIKHTNILLLLAIGILALFLFSAVNLMQFPLAYKTYQQETDQLLLLSNSDEIIQNLRTHTEKLEAQMEKQGRKKIPIHKHLDFVAYLEKLSREIDTRIIALPREEKLKNQGFQILKESFSLESGIQNILILLHRIEWEDRVGSISYLDLSRRKILTGKARKRILVADVELQRVGKL